MIAKELKNEISDALLSAETALSKSKIMVSDLYNDYFGEVEPDDWNLQAYYYNAQTKNSIANDYLIELENHLKEIEDILEATEQQGNTIGRNIALEAEEYKKEIIELLDEIKEVEILELIHRFAKNIAR